MSINTNPTSRTHGPQHTLIELDNGQRHDLIIEGIANPHVTRVDDTYYAIGSTSYDWHHAFPDQYRCDGVDFEDIDAYLSQRSQVIVDTVQQLYGATSRDDLKTDGLAFEFRYPLSQPLTIAQAKTYLTVMISTAVKTHSHTIDDLVERALLDHDARSMHSRTDR